jgi:hypothetical protein
MLTLKDIRPGQCWRFAAHPDAPDYRPTLTYEGNVYPQKLARNWDTWKYDGPEDDSTFYTTNKDLEIVFLHHHDVAPEGVPLTEVVDVLALARDRLRHQFVGSLPGIECLRRYAYAQRYEQLCRVPGGFVSTHGENGLDCEQVKLAQELWAIELKIRQRDLAEKRRLQVVCDDQYEL